MATTAVNIDAENPKNELFQQNSKLHVKEGVTHSSFQEAAALLTIWSILVINEGAIRLINSNPAEGLDRGGRPSPVLLFLAGLFEVFFGLVGLFVGMAAFVFKWYNTEITKLAMIIQTLLGYFVFVIYVFVQPAFRATDLTEPILEGLTIGESKFIIALGVLTSFHFCLALQGGQFVFFARLISAATGRNFLMQQTGNRMRAIFWNTNFALSGLWTLITGAVINSSVGGGKLAAPFVSPPNVGRLPGLTITTGLVMLVWGLIGVAIAFSKSVPWMYYLLSGIVYLFGFLNFTIVQFGLIEPNGGAVALHAGLVYMVVFMGPYFVYQQTKETAVSE